MRHLKYAFFAYLLLLGISLKNLRRVYFLFSIISNISSMDMLVAVTAAKPIRTTFDRNGECNISRKGNISVHSIIIGNPIPKKAANKYLLHLAFIDR